MLTESIYRRCRESFVSDLKTGDTVYFYARGHKCFCKSTIYKMPMRNSVSVLTQIGNYYSTCDDRQWEGPAWVPSLKIYRTLEEAKKMVFINKLSGK